jgi:hypothetical protein
MKIQGEWNFPLFEKGRENEERKMGVKTWKERLFVP